MHLVQMISSVNRYRYRLRCTVVKKLLPFLKIKMSRKQIFPFMKFMKLQADISFIKTCRREYLVPIFANIMLATRSGTRN